MMWDTVFQVIASGPQAAFVDPFLMRGYRDGVLLVDRDRSITAVDGRGRVLWRFGRRGSGPGEFQRIRDVAVAPDGMILVWDSELGRLSYVRDGKLVRALSPTGIGHADRMTLTPHGVVLQRSEGPRPFVLLDSAGVVRTTIGTSWQGFDSLTHLQRQGFLAQGPGGRWAYAMSEGGGWFAFRDSFPEHFVGSYLERIPLPSLIVTTTPGAVRQQLPAPTYAARSIFWLGPELWIPFGADENEDIAFIDVFSSEVGAYLYSFEMPVRSDLVTGGLDGSSLYVLTADTATKLYRLRMAGAPSRPNQGAR